jgi:hypothetical protein
LEIDSPKRWIWDKASILLNCFSTFQTGVCYCLVLIDRRGESPRGAYSSVKILCIISNKTTPHLKLMTGYDLSLRLYHFKDKHNFLSGPHAIKMATFALIF